MAFAPGTPAATLAANLHRLSAKDRDFADSLLAAARGIMGASAKQTHWLGVLAQRAAGTAAPAPTIGDMAGLIALLDKASTSLKRPRIVLAIADLFTVRITVAGPASSEPGSLVFTDAKGGFDGRRYFGRISRNGNFTAGRDLKPADAPALVDALRELAADPVRAAVRHSARTGNCCFCGLELRTKASVFVGYGPICAEKYGLDWGYHSEAAA